VSLRGQDWARQKLDELVTSAAEMLSVYGAGSGILVEAARFVAYRSK